MNEIATVRKISRVEVLPATLRKSFAMWPLNAYGYEAHRQALCASTLDDAVKICTPPPIKASLAKGGFPSFVILETEEAARDGKARHTLHFYIVKSKRGYRRLGDWDQPVQAAVPYAVHAGSLAMNAFDPRRPFAVRAGDDPLTGLQPSEPPTIHLSTREPVRANNAPGRDQ